jgi:hypothetical protein
VLKRDYDTVVSPHGVNNVLARANLLKKHKKRRRIRKLDDHTYYPGERVSTSPNPEHLVSYKTVCFECSCVSRWAHA